MIDVATLERVAATVDPAATLVGRRDVAVEGLTLDSRRVHPGVAFACVRGAEHDGHEFASEAAAAGAPLLVVDHVLEPSLHGPAEAEVSQLVVGDVRAVLGPLAAELWGRPSTRMAVVGVTGTNGKTTTTQLTATMLQEDGRRVAPCGNIGIPVLDAVRDPGGFDVLVVEISSFQLHWLPTSGPGAPLPAASVCLNLAEDHYDWHGSAEAYAAAKAKVYENTRIAAVFNRDDPATIRMVENAEVQEGCRAIGFGPDTPGLSDVGVVDDILVDRAFLEERRTSALELAELADVAAAGLATPHGLANTLAAAALARALGAAPASIRDALRRFRVDHHRTELIAVAREIAWVDDSKATNPHAAASALKAYRSVVWIVGGLLKGVDLAPLVEAHRDRLRAAVIIGTDRDTVRAVFERHAPLLPLFEVDGDDTEGVMPTAVRLAAGVAESGDTVLLAPAAASMDQFVDYADRGRRFSQAVREHLEGEAHDDGPPTAGSAGA